MTPWAVPGFAQAPERLSDKDVKTLIDQVDEGRDKFEGNLDGQFKGSTLRGPAGETKVAAALQDYQDNTKKLQEPLQLRLFRQRRGGHRPQAVHVDRHLHARLAERHEGPQRVGPPGHEPQASGGGVWHHVSSTRWSHGPPDERQGDGGRGRSQSPPRRNTSKTTSTKPARSRSPTARPPRRTSRLLVKQANAVKSRTNDGKPATAELRQLVDQAAKLQTFVDAHPVPPAATNWQAVQASLGKLQQAFGLMK